MDFLEWVDLTDAQHVEALRHWMEVGSFPERFVPDNVQMGTHWIPGLLGLMAKAFLDNAHINKETIITGLLEPGPQQKSDPSSVLVYVHGATDVTTQVLDSIARVMLSKGAGVYLSRGARKLAPDVGSLSRRHVILSYQ